MVSFSWLCICFRHCINVDVQNVQYMNINKARFESFLTLFGVHAKLFSLFGARINEWSKLADYLFKANRLTDVRKLNISSQFRFVYVLCVQTKAGPFILSLLFLETEFQLRKILSNVFGWLGSAMWTILVQIQNG